MDGASKFVRGDVVAAMIILVVNMVGGLLIGTLQDGLPLADAARTYTLLTVGDGLAAQIPSLAISIAAGLVVTRVSTGEDIGQQIKSQISRYPAGARHCRRHHGRHRPHPADGAYPLPAAGGVLGIMRLPPLAPQRRGGGSRQGRRRGGFRAQRSRRSTR